MDNRPGIAIVSCSKTKPKSLIKLIAKTQDIDENPNQWGIVQHPWFIDTKYYTAEVNLLGIETPVENDDCIKGIEALIIHFDSNTPTGLEDLKKWEFVTNAYNVDIRLLLANYCTDTTKITNNQALDWCLKRGFEFIELYPSTQNSEQDESIIEEKFGVNRVIEALQSHTWSNLVMKDKKKMTLTTTNEPSNQDLDIKNSIPNDHLDDFTDLFSQLQTMKDSLQGMPRNQRQHCAEQMVTAFWKAIGGEEEEIFDL